MPTPHRSFWTDFGGKVGVPLFAGTLVASLLGETFTLIHGILMGTGMVLLYMDHRWNYHDGKDAD